MKTSAMIPSKFLKKDDFEQPQVCTMRTVKLEEVGQDGETRWVLYFNEHDKGMVLNTTSIRLLESTYGDESDEWTGKKVKVYVDPNVAFAGKIVGGLRLAGPSKPKAAPAPAAVLKDEIAPDFNDDIPF